MTTSERVVAERVEEREDTVDRAEDMVVTEKAEVRRDTAAAERAGERVGTVDRAEDMVVMVCIANLRRHLDYTCREQ